MNKSRLEAFSDGVLAIIITIMVLEIKAPRGTEWKSLQPLIPDRNIERALKDMPIKG